MSRDEAKEMKRTTYGVLVALCVLLAFMPANASDFTLEIFGNANMDDIIDELDVEYVQGIIDGTNDETELADANQDGKVDQIDIDRIEQIIEGSEPELHYIDYYGDVKRVKHPLNEIIIIYDNLAEIIRILGAEDRVVGIDSEEFQGAIGKYPHYFPEFQQMPSIGTRSDCDAEVILELNPDAIISGVADGCPEIEEKLKDYDIDIVRFRSSAEGLESLMMLAYMLDEVDNANKYREWQNRYLDMVRDRVASIPLDERPRVFMDRPGGTTVARGSGYSEAIEAAGGINIAAYLIGSKNYPQVDTEWVLEQNPDVIIGLSWDGGYEVDDIEVLKTRYDEILETPGFGDTNAGKNNEVYVTYFITTLGPGDHIGVLYYAKWLYPDLFQDLDPQAVHQEYIDKFQNVDYDLEEHGVFVYPNYDS